jgi:hypothetical protein
MAKFISIDSGWLNLDHVVRVEESDQADGRTVLLFRNAADKIIGRSYSADDFWKHAAPILPAAAGAFALVVTTHNRTDERPHERPDAVYSSRVPIVGWHVGYEWPSPVLPEEAAHNQRVFVELPGGMVMSPDDVVLESREAAEKHCLAEAQASWDRRNAKADGARRDQP